MAGIHPKNRGETQADTQIGGQFPRPRGLSAKQYSTQAPDRLAFSGQEDSSCPIELSLREKLLEPEYKHRFKLFVTLESTRCSTLGG